MGNNMIRQCSKPSISEKDIKRIYKRFLAVDMNKDGFLDAEDLLTVPEIADNPLHKRVISLFDHDEDGKISFLEFLVGLGRLTSIIDANERLKFAFNIYNIDKDDVISNGDLFTVVKMMVGNNLNDQQLQQLVDRTIIQADKNGDGLISYDEFCNFVSDIHIEDKLQIDI